jgi:hypothetical protein
MFFPFIAVAAIAAAFIQLGALSVWVSVLSLTIKAMLLAAIAAALFFALRRFAQ